MKTKNPGKEAIEFVKKYEKKRTGTKPEDVQHKQGEHKGYDLVSTDTNGKELHIEVKGATRYHGIPDPYITEFNKKTKEMTADILYVVYFPRDEDEKEHGKEPILYKIPKSAIKHCRHLII